VRKSIGTLTGGTFQKLKRGIREVLVAAAVKAKRLKAKLGAPTDYVMDTIVERQENIASGTHREGFASEMLVPSLPDLAVYETVHLPVSRMGEKRPKRKKPREIDELCFVHLRGWMCRDHYTARRTFFAPWNGATAPLMGIRGTICRALGEGKGL